MLDLRTCSIEELQRLLDRCHCDLREIAHEDPSVIDQLDMQVQMDEKMYGRRPTYIRVSTNSGLVNTTIRTSDFLRFIQLWKQRPDLVDTPMAEALLKPKNVPLVSCNESDSVVKELGVMPIPINTTK